MNQALGILALFWCTQLYAFDVNVEHMGLQVPKYEECLEEASSDADLAACDHLAYRYYEQVLQAKYEQVQEKCRTLGDSDTCLAQVKAVQDSWLKYRDSVLMQQNSLLFGDSTLAMLERARISNLMIMRQIQFVDSMINGSNKL